MSDKPGVGMTADEVLRLPNREWWNAEGWCGHKVGNAVEWRYEDCTVILEHDGVLWRVAEVRDAGNPG